MNNKRNKNTTNFIKICSEFELIIINLLKNKKPIIIQYFTE